MFWFGIGEQNLSSVQVKSGADLVLEGNLLLGLE